MIHVYVSSKYPNFRLLGKTLDTIFSTVITVGSNKM